MFLGSVSAVTFPVTHLFHHPDGPPDGDPYHKRRRGPV